MKFSKQLVVVALLTIGLLGAQSCKKKPATKEEATKEIISSLIDTCKAGKTEDAAKQYNDTLADEDKSRRGIDFSTADGKEKAGRLCNDLTRRYGAGYEFGKMENQGEMIAWNVFPKGGNEGQLFAFKQVNGRWIIVDVDPAKR